MSRSGDTDGCIGCFLITGILAIAAGIGALWGWPAAIIATGIALLGMGMIGLLA